MEFKFKGTKGKWEIVPSLSKPAYNVIGTQLGGKFKIARCPYFVNPYSEEVTFKDEQEAKYNALLISKAPELLEMLRQILKENEIVIIQGLDSRKVIDLIKEATEL